MERMHMNMAGMQVSKDGCKRSIRWSTFGMILLLLTGLSPANLNSQVAGTGTIEGTITDPSGATIPGSLIVVTNTATGQKSTQKTSSSGTYSISALTPGDYLVEVQAPGFRSLVQSHVVVNAVTVVGLNFSLQIGPTSEIVTVSGAPPELDTANGSTGNTIPNTTYSSLPLVMSGGPKSPVGFLNLVPGSTYNPGLANGGLAAPSLNGGAGNTSHLYIDGLPLEASELQGDTRNLAFTSTEVVDSFQVITAGVPAYYEGQGITNLVYKSGTNSFHGDVYENFRNTSLDAAGYFSTSTPVEHQNEFGATLGGPILRKRIFFFGAYDGYRLSNGAVPSLFSIPTTAERGGDFSALPTVIYNPATTQCANGICTRQPFPKNLVTGISAISQNLQSYLPTPINGSLQNNYAYQYVSGTTQNEYMAKVDGDVTSKNRASLVFQAATVSPTGDAGLSGLPIPYNDGRQAINKYFLGQIRDTHIFSPNLLNVFGFQVFIDPSTTNVVTASGNYPSKAGLTGLPPGTPTTAFPPIAFNGGSDEPTRWGGSGGSSSQFFVETSQVEFYQDNIQWVRGKHSFTFGGEVNIQQENVGLPSVLNQIDFNNTETAGFIPGTSTIDTTTGNAYASFLLGLVNDTNAQDTTLSVQGARYKQFAMYAQDDWKLRSNLTLNLGLRYDLPLPYVEAKNRISWLNPSLANPEIGGYPGALQFAGYGSGKCNCRTDVKTHYLTFGPRVGFAYEVHPDTVVRGSFGIVDFLGGALGGGGLSFGVSTLGYTTNASTSSPDGGITPAFNWNNNYPPYPLPPVFSPTLSTGYNTSAPGDQGGVGYDRPQTAGRSPYTENWTLTVEQRLPAQLVSQLTYAGSSSHFLAQGGGVGIYSDQIDPKYLALGGLLSQQATSTTIAQAAAIVPGVKLPYANFIGSIGQMLRPFPQYDGSGANFAGPDPWATFATAHYNSLQAQLSRRMANGLYVLAAYTWSRTIDQGGATINFIVPGARSAYRWNAERSLSGGDQPNVISLSYVYQLPFGKGRLFPLRNRAVDTIAGGWQLSGIQQYSSGTPLGTFSTGKCNVPYAGGCYADYATTFAGFGRLGKIGSGNPRTTSYFNVNAFQDPAPFTFGTTPRIGAYGLRNMWNLNEDFALAKDFALTDRFTFRFQADAFNAFNRTTFGGIQTNIDSSSFGQVSGQVNTPRQLQLEAYIKF